MKHLFLITGPKGHGKDTVAKEIQRKLQGLPGGFPLYQTHLSALALPLKRMTSAVVGLSMHDLEDREIKEASHPSLGMSPREFQILIGKALTDQDPLFFVNLWWQHTHSSVEIGIVPDVRFLREIAGFKEAYSDAAIHLLNVRRERAVAPHGEIPPSELLGWNPPPEAYPLLTIEGQFAQMRTDVEYCLKECGL
jgi:hypothetical protein